MNTTNHRRNPYRKLNRSNLSLGELVAIVGSCSRSDRETLATLIDLFATGRVRLRDPKTTFRSFSAS